MPNIVSGVGRPVGRLVDPSRDERLRWCTYILIAWPLDVLVHGESPGTCVPFGGLSISVVMAKQASDRTTWIRILLQDLDRVSQAA